MDPSKVTAETNADCCLPRLLVSVRNAAEAVSALAGGCDILDVKEPRHGSLGMADVEQIDAVLEIARSSTAIDPINRRGLAPGYAFAETAPIPVSAALGEAAEWLTAQSVPAIPSGLAYVKMGTAGLAKKRSWEDVWQSAREKFCTGTHGNRLAPPAWITVAYADWQPAGAPHPAAVLEAAANRKWGGVLIDTHSKTGRGLFHWLTRAEIAELVAQAADLNVPFALAGSLTLADVPPLIAIAPEIIGIRTAACRGGVRQAEIDAAAVRAFKETMRSGGRGWRIADSG